MAKCYVGEGEFWYQNVFAFLCWERGLNILRAYSWHSALDRSWKCSGNFRWHQKLNWVQLRALTSVPPYSLWPLNT